MKCYVTPTSLPVRSPWRYGSTTAPMRSFVIMLGLLTACRTPREPAAPDLGTLTPSSLSRLAVACSVPLEWGLYKPDDDRTFFSVGVSYRTIALKRTEPQLIRCRPDDQHGFLLYLVSYGTEMWIVQLEITAPHLAEVESVFINTIAPEMSEARQFLMRESIYFDGHQNGWPLPGTYTRVARHIDGLTSTSYWQFNHVGFSLEHQ